MRIAQLAPLAEGVSPKLYGGTERVIAWLVDELVELGHDVTLFASGDSRTRGKLHAAWPRALRLRRKGVDPTAACALLIEAIAERKREAIRIARAAGKPLRIAAKIPRAETAYFRQHFSPISTARTSSSSAKSTTRGSSRF